MLLSRAEFHRFMRHATDCGQRDLHIIIERLDHMATQEDIDGLTATVTDLKDTVNTGVGNIREDIARIQAAVDAGDPVDLTDLQASVAGLSSAVAGVTELDDENPAPQPPAENF